MIDDDEDDFDAFDDADHDEDRAVPGPGALLLLRPPA